MRRASTLLVLPALILQLIATPANQAATAEENSFEEDNGVDPRRMRHMLLTNLHGAPRHAPPRPDSRGRF